MFPSARIETLVAEHGPVGGPFIFQSWRDHNDDGTRFWVAENHRTGDGEGDESFAHTDLIRKDDPGTLMKAVEYGLGGDLLAISVSLANAVSPVEPDFRGEFEI